MNAIELFAAVLGLVNVALVVQRSLWNYPFGIAMVALYFFVFLENRLYSDALLQIFFLVIQVYGWVNWRAAKADEGSVPVAEMRWSVRASWAIVTGLAIVGWGQLVYRVTDVAQHYSLTIVYLDAAIAGLSVAAQLLQSFRRIESWVLWIIVDLIAVPLYWWRGLVPSSLLYAVFLLMSVIGLISWSMRLRRQREAMAAVP